MICKLVPEKCIACGLCQVLAPALFDYSDDGIVLFADTPSETTRTIPEDNQEQCLEAYKQCPTHAIVIQK